MSNEYDRFGSIVKQSALCKYLREKWWNNCEALMLSVNDNFEAPCKQRKT